MGKFFEAISRKRKEVPELGVNAQAAQFVQTLLEEKLADCTFKDEFMRSVDQGNPSNFFSGTLNAAGFIIEEKGSQFIPVQDTPRSYSTDRRPKNETGRVKFGKFPTRKTIDFYVNAFAYYETKNIYYIHFLVR